MYRLSTALLVVAAVALVGGSARADFIPWSYSWSADPQVSNGTGGGINFFPTSGSNTGSQSMPNGVVLVAFAPNGTDPQSLNNAPYNLSLHLTDTTSGTSADLPFSGTLSGDLLKGSVVNAFTSPLTQTATLGGNLYTVTAGFYNPPGAPGSGVQGSLGANVVVSAPGGGPVVDVPEPGGLVLGGVAVLALGGWCWRERRRLRNAAPTTA
jgi:hypothetical protein